MKNHCGETRRGFFPLADPSQTLPSQTLHRPFTDPSQTLRIGSGLRLRASAQGQNDNIRRRFFADAQNDKREAQNDKGETQNDRKGEAE